MMLHCKYSTGIRGLFRPEIGGAKALTQEPRSTKIERKKSWSASQERIQHHCLAGSAICREILIYLKVNMYFTKKKEISIKKKEKKMSLTRICNCI